MAYIIGFVVVLLLFFAFYYFTEFDKKQKLVVIGTISIIILSAIIFNNYTISQNDKMRDVVLKFNQHKTVKCEGIDINSSNYTLSIGTYTFIGKKNTPNYARMVSVSQCY